MTNYFMYTEHDIEMVETKEAQRKELKNMYKTLELTIITLFLSGLISIIVVNFCF